MAKKKISAELFAAIDVACRLFGREIPRDFCDQGMFGFTARNFYAIIAKILEIIAANEQLVMEFSELLAREKRESGGEGADAAEPIGPGEPEPEGPEGQPGETPELDDYTRRLEMMVRLYRTRSEAAVDAVCDCLLPGLAEEE